MGQHSSSPLRVYYDPQSYNCIRVLVYLREANLPHQLIKVSLVESDFDEEFLRRNPKKRVPFLMHGDTITIDDSVGIIEYLGRIAPNEDLFPTKDQSSCALNCRLIGKYHHKLEPKSVLGAVMWLQKSRAEIGEERIQELFKELDSWEDYLAQENEYLLGKNVATSDIIAFPVIACFFWLLGLSEKDYPFLAAWYHRMRSRSSIKDLEFWQSYVPKNEWKVLAVRKFS